MVPQRNMLLYPRVYGLVLNKQAKYSFGFTWKSSVYVYQCVCVCGSLFSFLSFLFSVLRVQCGVSLYWFRISPFCILYKNVNQNPSSMTVIQLVNLKRNCQKDKKV